MKLIYRILTGAALSVCLLSFAGCGNKAESGAESAGSGNASSAAPKTLEMEVKPTGNRIQLDGLAAATVWPGDVLTGNINITEGLVTEAPGYCKIDGQDYYGDTQMKYYSFYDSASRCFLFGTNVQSEQEALASLSAQWKEYLQKSADGTVSAEELPKDTVAVTGIAVSMTDDIRDSFREWYGEGFDKNCASVNLFITYHE